KDTIRQFGWTTLKALTVHGCDSITYVRLDTLYIHREQHFYDTLHTCEGGALSWRGREIAQTGEYADTVFDPYKGGTDSVYHLRADIYPTYKDVVHRAAVERDSLPYIYGKDTIRQFGLTELHRYQTVHGCDSVTYVQLDRVYRERHFYDTLQSCGPAQFTWRGTVMIAYRTSDYIDSMSDPNMGGAKTYHHLHIAISYPYDVTYTDSCYIEELPYAVAGRTMPAYGTHVEKLVSEPVCDSVCRYVLLRRWHWYHVQVRVKGAGSVNVTDTVLREDASLGLYFTASSCYRLSSLTVDGRVVPLQSRYELKDLHGDCTVEVGFSSLASAETRVEKRVCVDSLPVVYNGEVYGAGEHEIVLRNAAGCDSVVRLQVQ
ncbi:MAG: hypothetical protein K2M92_03825, partial [Bacteroidales bacterium]|nr:hypothetical protein [Bacteroidales bacterium]